MRAACVELHQPAAVEMVFVGRQEFTLCLGEGVLRPFLQAHPRDIAYRAKSRTIAMFS